MWKRFLKRLSGIAYAVGLEVVGIRLLLASFDKDVEVVPRFVDQVNEEHVESYPSIVFEDKEDAVAMWACMLPERKQDDEIN